MDVKQPESTVYTFINAILWSLSHAYKVINKCFRHLIVQ